jgi:hypothetical protein
LNFIDYESKATEIDQLIEGIEAHPDVIQKYQEYKLMINNNFYVEDYPISSKYRMNLLLDPCRFNSYNCCVNTYGSAEYPALLQPGLEQERVYKYIVLGNDSEVQKNFYYVYEDGTAIAPTDQRSADDFAVWNHSCSGLNAPTSECQALNYQFQRASLRPACLDNNYSLNALEGCLYPQNGTKPRYNCVQVGYYTNTMVPQCTDNDHCGTYLEIHIPNGTPYSDETVVVSEVLLDQEYTSGYSTTVIPLSWQGNDSRVLCSYSESILRIGSLVYIKSSAPVCCCPPPFDPVARVGSFQCPRGPVADGAFAYKSKTIADEILVDSFLLNYPFCFTDLTATRDE